MSKMSYYDNRVCDISRKKPFADAPCCYFVCLKVCLTVAKME